MLRFGPCIPRRLEFTDICLSIGIKTAEDPGIVGLGRVPGMEAGIGCLCRLWRWSREDREPGTGPIWRLVEGAWVITELDWGDGMAC